MEAFFVFSFASSGYVSKPELYNWKMGSVSEETAVFTPYLVILVTVTSITGACTRVGHPACALTTARWCSAPVRHLSCIAWYPPSKSLVVVNEDRTMTLIFDKLLTVRGDSGETRQLRQTRSRIVNVTWVASLWIASIHQCSALLLWLMTVTPIPSFSVMLQVTLNGGKPPSPSGSMT